MRKKQKQEILEFIESLYLAHKEIENVLENEDVISAQRMLCDCQECAIELGNIIETFEGEGVVTISYIEKYCEALYLNYQKLEEINEWKDSIEKNELIQRIMEHLQQHLSDIENSIKKDIKEKKEIVFLPYKASMWDSLESIYLAAKEDENCDVYCVPIPYFDKNPDEKLRKIHYEEDDFPDYVPVVWHGNYDISKRKPDVVYIHNPYDEWNSVTSVDPKYYSKELRKHTDCLVYVPYYATAGGMSEGQALCPAYIYADYIVIQAEKYRDFFDKSIPKEKFLALGSPKFDKIIHMCNQKKDIPECWKSKMKGKKVYFYNTSIGGMLYNTQNYLKKMEYVFRCFQGRDDVCILWRPHPLMESTFGSLRKELLPEYIRLKKYFIEKKIGIYDETPDMSRTIALCDAYIGDSATSVTSIFGIAGKPVFILNNMIIDKPEKDDWKGRIIKGFSPYRDDKWMVTQGNKLYYSPKSDYKYEYYCNLSEYAAGDYYGPVFEIDGKVYVCPLNAQDILIVEKGMIVKRISLEKHLSIQGAFCDALRMGNKIYLIPFRYPTIVVYDIEKDTLEYIRGYQNLYTKNMQGQWCTGGRCIWKNYLLISFPEDYKILAIDYVSGENYILEVKGENSSGFIAMGSDGENVWGLPYYGNIITCWNPQTGEIKEYKNSVADFVCINPITGEECMDRPFSSVAFDEEYIYLAPCWGNQYLRIHKKSGEVKAWIPFYPDLKTVKNGYFNHWSRGAFIAKTDNTGKRSYRYFSVYDSKLYEIDFETQRYEEVEINFKIDDLMENEAGFCECSEWLQYACEENAINSLENLLNGTLKGNSHNKAKQAAAYSKIAANNDGTCGEKIHEVICGKN